MTAAGVSFTCKACGHTLTRWLGQCPQCKAWESIATTVGAVRVKLPLSTSQSSSSPGSPSSVDRGVSVHRATSDGDGVRFEPYEAPPVTMPMRITDVAEDELERIETGVEPFDRVLGGGLVADSVILIGGDPGAGKSTLLAQAVAGVGQRVLYVTGEETIEQATMRARRVGAAHPEIWIVPCNDVDEALGHARQLRPAIIVVDSIQVFSSSDTGGVQGSVSQVRACTARFATFAKREHAIVIIIGHVTKDGSIAGPNTLMHLVDAVFLLEAAELGNRRTLRASKNRYGSTAEVGMFEMCADGMRPLDPADVEIAELTAESAADADRDARATEARPTVIVTDELRSELGLDELDDPGELQGIS